LPPTTNPFEKNSYLCTRFADLYQPINLKMMTKIKGKSLLITGGASGIGRIMGRFALEKGARCLIIWDINGDGIKSSEL
jgi:NADPH:quinone reductase-like Zn-dependent oxidoreductase